MSDYQEIYTGLIAAGHNPETAHEATVVRMESMAQRLRLQQRWKEYHEANRAYDKRGKNRRANEANGLTFRQEEP